MRPDSQQSGQLRPYARFSICFQLFVIGEGIELDYPFSGRDTVRRRGVPGRALWRNNSRSPVKSRAYRYVQF
jgi:hypothetical protein